jgi:hypothetical protein
VYKFGAIFIVLVFNFLEKQLLADGMVYAEYKG